MCRVPRSSSCLAPSRARSTRESRELSLLPSCVPPLSRPSRSLKSRSGNIAIESLCLLIFDRPKLGHRVPNARSQPSQLSPALLVCSQRTAFICRWPKALMSPPANLPSAVFCASNRRWVPGGPAAPQGFVQMDDGDKLGAAGIDERQFGVKEGSLGGE